MVILEATSNTSLIALLADATEKGARPEAQIFWPEFIWGDVPNVENITLDWGPYLTPGLAFKQRNVFTLLILLLSRFRSDSWDRIWGWGWGWLMIA